MRDAHPGRYWINHALSLTADRAGEADLGAVGARPPALGSLEITKAGVPGAAKGISSSRQRCRVSGQGRRGWTAREGGRRRLQVPQRCPLLRTTGPPEGGRPTACKHGRTCYVREELVSAPAGGADRPGLQAWCGRASISRFPTGQRGEITPGSKSPGSSAARPRVKPGIPKPWLFLPCRAASQSLSRSCVWRRKCLPSLSLRMFRNKAAPGMLPAWGISTGWGWTSRLPGLSQPREGSCCAPSGVPPPLAHTA